jgi:hypothetical protein
MSAFVPVNSLGASSYSSSSPSPPNLDTIPLLCKEERLEQKKRYKKERERSIAPLIGSGARVVEAPDPPFLYVAK